MQTNILLVDDDQEFCNLIQDYFERFSYDVTSLVNPNQALEAIEQSVFELVILDKHMPELNGIELAKSIRDHYPELPIIMLTGDDDDLSHVLALEININDYEVKPISLRLLYAKVNALLRRCHNSQASVPETSSHQFTFEGFRLDTIKRQLISKDNSVVHLSVTEYELLEVLLKNAGNVLTREQLIEQTSSNLPLSAEDRRVDVFICNIRKKLGSEIGSLLKSVRNVGYIFSTEAN